MIPKIIWSYWHDENIPFIYKKCIDSWFKHNDNGWTINILNDTNIHLYVKTFPKYYDGLMIQKKADYIRLYLLKHHGGVWLDTGILINKSLDWVIETNKQNVGYYIKGFSSNSDNTVVENWFIACSKDNYIIDKWYVNFKQIFDNHNNDNFTTSDIYIKTNKQKIVGPDYLFMHIVYQYLLQTDSIFLDCHNKSFLNCAEDTAFSIQTFYNWNTNKINLFSLLYCFKNNIIKSVILNTLGICIQFNKISNMIKEQNLVKFRGCDTRTIKDWEQFLF